MLPTTMLDQEQISPQRIRPLRRCEYDQLVELGVFRDGERIELLRGALVTMSPQKPPHAGVTGRLTDVLATVLGRRVLVRCQLPFAATDDSEPEPDVAVVPRRSYDRAHPSSAHLIIEVAYDSVRKDSGVKAGVYAEAGVAEYWVVNLPEDVIDVFTQPGPGGYATRRRAVRGDRIRLVAFAAVELEVDAILPARRRPRTRRR